MFGAVRVVRLLCRVVAKPPLACMNCCKSLLSLVAAALSVVLSTLSVPSLFMVTPRLARLETLLLPPVE